MEPEARNSAVGWHWNTYFFMFKMHVLRNNSMYNNEIWQVINSIIVQKPVEQIIDIGPKTYYGYVVNV